MHNMCNFKENDGQPEEWRWWPEWSCEGGFWLTHKSKHLWWSWVSSSWDADSSVRLVGNFAQSSSLRWAGQCSIIHGWQIKFKPHNMMLRRLLKYWNAPKIDEGGPLCISKTWFLCSSAFLNSTIVVSRSLFLFQCRAAPPDATSNSLLEYGAHSASRLPLVTPSLGRCTLAPICTPTSPGEYRRPDARLQLLCT